MRAGTLRQVISIQEETETKNDYGEVLISYNEIKETRAGIYPVKGEEKYINAELLNTVSHKIEIRYDSNINITPKNRVVFNGRIFDIESVINLSEKNVTLFLFCSEKFNEV